MKSFYRITSYEQEEAKYKVWNNKQAFVHIHEINNVHIFGRNWHVVNNISSIKLTQPFKYVECYLNILKGLDRSPLEENPRTRAMQQKSKL